MELYSNFNKKFSFKNENYLLPESEHFFQENTVVENYEALQIIKRILNFVKSKLNHYKIEGKYAIRKVVNKKISLEVH